MSLSRPAFNSSKGRCEVEVRYDVRIPTANQALTLSADLHLPKGVGSVPALVTLTPYRKDFAAGVGHNGSATWFAEHGYASVLVDIAGTGSSDGIRRPDFDPGEGDDAIAAIAWVASRPWCDGNVGMWGISYGAITTLRTASLQPPQLKAIMPLMHGLDPGNDTIHPDTARGDFHALAGRGSFMLALQLLPPLWNHNAAEEQSRWRHRLDETEPAFLDVARHRNGDAVWQDRAIAGESIAVPTLCIGGWRDAFPDAVCRVFERIQGPKKLLLGPWGHVLPHQSAFEPIDFLPLALRWWDRWLRTLDNGVMDEPPVTVFVEGDNPGWRTYQSWPPTKCRLDLTTRGDTTLSEPTSDSVHQGGVIGVYQPDATIGALRGLPGLMLGELCVPQDQHEDDVRSLTATSLPLHDGLLIVGRPEVVVRLAGPSLSEPPQRIVARLCEVDADGRATFITAGVLCPDAASDTLRIELRPTAYRVLAGRRLRVALSDSDFPRLTPLIDATPFHVAGISVSLPDVAEDAGASIEMPPVEGVEPTSAETGSDWTITRDLIHDGVEVVVSLTAPAGRTPHGHTYHTCSELRAAVRRNRPDAVIAAGANTITVQMSTGEDVVVRADVRTTQAMLWARGTVAVDSVRVYSRIWEAPL